MIKPPLPPPGVERDAPAPICIGGRGWACATLVGVRVGPAEADATLLALTPPEPLMPTGEAKLFTPGTGGVLERMSNSDDKSVDGDGLTNAADGSRVGEFPVASVSEAKSLVSMRRGER